MKESVPVSDWFRIISPAVLGIVSSVLGIIISYAGLEASGGWSFLGVIMLAPVIAILFALDFIVKLIFRDRTLIIWLVEILAMCLIYVFWIANFA
jgi:hypothetical protein